ncbi:hypothetical protein BGZ93_006701 [Podila epicladia]|nr:hypothetical protein BGZ92_006104 [Podila epicladia]KAG0094844.1 hypothetical protein BGZ93_006701 [Podila epicladia]
MNGSTSASSDSGSDTIDASSASPDFDITCKHELAISACVNEKHEEALSTPKESFPTQADVDLLSTTGKSSVTTTTLEPTSDIVVSSSEVNTTPDNTGNTKNIVNTVNTVNTDIQNATSIHPISSINDTIVSPTLPPTPIPFAEQHSDAQPLTTDQIEAISSLSQDDANQPQEPVQGTFSAGYKQEFSARLSALSVNIGTTESGMALPSSSSSPSSTSFSSSSSLSEFLLIGQTEREDSEFDRHSEQSFESHDSYGERYNEALDTSSLSQSSASSSTGEPSMQRESHRQNHRHSRVCDEEYEQYSDGSFQGYHRHKFSTSPEPSKERSAEFNSGHSFSSRFVRPSSPTNSERIEKRRAHRASPPPENPHAPAPASSPILPPLPALKLPSVRGIAKSMVELVIATVVCVSLIGAMFAFSYVSTGTKHLLGWYSDQRFGQRIRERIREREHFVQEALEKMAGEEYVKIKRRSRAGQQQYGYTSSGNQYNRQNYQDQQQQQNEQPYERESLSNAEWQELIRAASMSFMSKFSAPSGHH